jgi:hypothetical protein
MDVYGILTNMLAAKHNAISRKVKIFFIDWSSGFALALDACVSKARPWWQFLL